MGADASTIATVILIFFGIFLCETGIFYIANRRFLKNITLKSIKILISISISAFVIQGGTYGISTFMGKSSVIEASFSFPFYHPVTFQTFLTKMGFKPYRKSAIEIKEDKNADIAYPLKPIKTSENYPKYNIVWLVSESLRADMLNKEIMPSAWEFAKKSQHFLNHYSAGNGTRMGMFGMFYGLSGNYWFKFLYEQTPPVIMNLLKERNYNIELFTSAAFTYPEFDKTVFSGIPDKNMHQDAKGPAGWQKDRENTGRIIDILNNHDKNRQVMIFMFFESPHARYYFPPESEIRKNYLPEFNYATVDTSNDIELIRNRYINSCYHLDTQIERILDSLAENDLLKNTIVIITGDHGEEFMEKGRWGHNSSFVEEQVKPPMLIFVPGMEPKTYDKITSHLDIAPTIMHLLGVTNPPEDYSLGYDMLGDKKRDHSLIADWNNVCYVDNDCKIIIPLKASSSMFSKITAKNDKIIDNSSAVYAAKSKNLLAVMKEVSMFTKHKK